MKEYDGIRDAINAALTMYGRASDTAIDGAFRELLEAVKLLAARCETIERNQKRMAMGWSPVNAKKC